jgi:hypothetical protein
VQSVHLTALSRNLLRPSSRQFYVDLASGNLPLVRIYSLLGYYAAWCCNYLPTFRYNISVPSSRVKSRSRKESRHREVDCMWEGARGVAISRQPIEHSRHTRLGQADRSAVAEHRLTDDRHIRFQDTQILSTQSCYMNQLISSSPQII